MDLLVEFALMVTTIKLWEQIRNERFNYQTSTKHTAFLISIFLNSINVTRFTKLDSI